MVKNKSDSEPTVQQIHNATERRAFIETIPNPLHRYKNYLELLFFSSNAIFCVRFLIASACLLTVTDKDSRIKITKIKPAAKIKLEDVTKPKKEESQHIGMGKKLQIKRVTTKANHKRE